MRKNIEKKYVVIIFFVSVLFFLGCMSFLIKQQKNFLFLDKFLKDMVYQIAYVIEIPVSKVEEWISDWKEHRKMHEEYEALRETASKTDFMASKYNEAVKVIEELESMLDLNSTLVESSYLNATVIGRNLGYFYDKITIDKGSASGIEEKMAVVTNEGLIGTVTHVGYTTSDIKLLTNSDVNQKISVKIKGDTDYSYGLLSGYDSNKKTFTITGIAGNKEIKEGAEVTTTGLGDIFPSGILIGYVKTITKDHFDLERIIEIESKVDFDAVRYVTVLKRKES